MTLFYICMYRFGDCYEIIADDIGTGKDRLKKKYVEMYRIYNGEDPETEEIEEMLSDLEISEMQLNKVKDF